MRRRSLEKLLNRLETLFADFTDTPPRTGFLSPEGIEEQLTQGLGGWVWECDAEGTLIWCSPEVERALGHDAEVLVGKKVFEVGLTEESAERLRSKMAATPWVENLRLQGNHKNGDPLSLIVNAVVRITPDGERIGYRGVTQIVFFGDTKPRRVAAALRGTSQESHPPQMAPELLGYLTTPHGYIDDEGQIRPLDGEPLQPPSQATIEGDLLVVPIRTKDETLGVMEFERIDQAWTDDDRTLVEDVVQQLTLALQDMRSHQLTQHALEEMREADRLKSQFLANMSHELRTPLNSIIGFSRVILKGIDGPINDVQVEDLTAIFSAGHHLLGLINDILDLSRIEAGKMELTFAEIDLADLIRSVMSTAVGLVKDKPIELILDLPDDLPRVQADSMRVRQVLLNLISNAAKFTEQGHIAISARQVKESDREAVLIAVSDTGLGINPKDQEKLFMPFSQVDASPTRKTGGTGLGLSISRHLVELHNGVIRVESVPGEGSTFAFTLPVEGPTDRSTHGEEMPLILGVSQDSQALERLRLPLEGLGYRFHPVDQHLEAPDVASALMPAAILLDLKISDGNGWRTLLETKKTNESSTIPVILFANTESDDKLATLGALDTLLKPIMVEAISSLLQRLDKANRQVSRVLVIDDDPDDLSQIRSTLRGLGCTEVKTALGGIEGIQSLRGEAPADLVLLNPLSRGGEGFAVLEALHRDEELRGVPLVLILKGTIEPYQFETLDRYSVHLSSHNAQPTDAFIDELRHDLEIVTSIARS